MSILLRPRLPLSCIRLLPADSTFPDKARNPNRLANPSSPNLSGFCLPQIVKTSLPALEAVLFEDGTKSTPTHMRLISSQLGVQVRAPQHYRHRTPLLLNLCALGVLSLGETAVSRFIFFFFFFASDCAAGCVSFVLDVGVRRFDICLIAYRIDPDLRPGLRFVSFPFAPLQNFAAFQFFEKRLTRELVHRHLFARNRSAKQNSPRSTVDREGTSAVFPLKLCQSLQAAAPISHMKASRSE